MPSLRLTWVLIRRNWLTLWFVVADCWYVLPNIRDFLSLRLLTDAVLYSDATKAWLTGGDPWLVSEGGTAFGAPPPTLLLYVPFAFLPSIVTALVWLVIDLLAVAFVIRRLNLPWWWVLFPPLAQAIVPANPEPVVVACLVAVGPVANAIAPLVKIYAFAPLLGERRWRPIFACVALLAISAAVLPWGLFIHDLPIVTATLVAQTASLSAFDVPFLLPIAVVGLAAVGLRRAGWLAVPVLWPHTQIHYAALSLPELSPLLAVGFSLPIPGAPPVALAAQALLERRQARVSYTTGKVAHLAGAEPRSVAHKEAGVRRRRRSSSQGGPCG